MFCSNTDFYLVDWVWKIIFRALKNVYRLNWLHKVYYIHAMCACLPACLPNYIQIHQNILRIKICLMKGTSSEVLVCGVACAILPFHFVRDGCVVDMRNFIHIYLIACMRLAKVYTIWFFRFSRLPRYTTRIRSFRPAAHTHSLSLSLALPLYVLVYLWFQYKILLPQLNLKPNIVSLLFCCFSSSRILCSFLLTSHS